MARTSKRLSALEVGRLNEPGKYPVGDGLYLQIAKQGTKSWIFRYSGNGKDTWMGLGSAQFISLADARLKAVNLRREVLNGENPLMKRVTRERIQLLEDSRRITFDECTKAYIAAHSPKWKNEKHISQWENTLKTYASPFIGSISVQDIDLRLTLKVLEPIWYKKTETASRVRGRIERILSWATVREYRTGANPAQWKGVLSELLPDRNSIQQVVHFKALPFKDIYGFMTELRKQEGVVPLALEFLILTATRTSETLQAKWSEFNMTDKCWTIPGERMKAGKEHRIPLTERMIQILDLMQLQSQGEFVFPGLKRGKPLSNTAFLMLLRRMNYKVTGHGFRSSFRDWAGEMTDFPRDIVELALAHVNKDRVESAYRRGDGFLKRRRLMDAWGKFCSEKATTGVVVDIHARSAVSFN